MNYTTEQKGEVYIIRLDEERLDTAVAPDLKAKFLMLAKQNERFVLLDMAKVEYADSSGLGAILFGIRQHRSAKKSIKLLNLQPRVLTLIKIAKLDDVVESFDDEEEALKSFKPL